MTKVTMTSASWRAVTSRTGKQLRHWGKNTPMYSACHWPYEWDNGSVATPFPSLSLSSNERLRGAAQLRPPWLLGTCPQTGLAYDASCAGCREDTRDSWRCGVCHQQRQWRRVCVRFEERDQALVVKAPRQRDRHRHGHRPPGKRFRGRNTFSGLENRSGIKACDFDSNRPIDLRGGRSLLRQWLQQRGSVARGSFMAKHGRQGKTGGSAVSDQRECDHRQQCSRQVEHPYESSLPAVYALDAKSGAEKWKWEIEEKVAGHTVSGIAADAGTLFVWMEDRSKSIFGFVTS